MYAPYDVYNFCDLCQSARLGNGVEIVRQRTADLRKKVKLLEGDILNDADDYGPLFTIRTDESSYNLKSPPQTIAPYNYRIYPMSLPGYHASQCVYPGPAFASISPQVAFADNKDAISQSGSTVSSKNKSQESLKSQTKENNATKMSSECKEMVQLCTALINELRETRTDLTTIVNKCLGHRSNVDNVAAIYGKDAEKVLTGKAEHSHKVKRKDSSYKRSKHKEKKKYGKVKKNEKSIKDEMSNSNAKENKKIARPEVLATLVDCLETMKTRPDCASAVEKLIDQLENKIVIKRSCDCPLGTSYNDVIFSKQNLEDSPDSSCQRASNYSCSEQGTNVNLRTVPATPSTVPLVEFQEDKIIEKELQVQKDLVNECEDDLNESKNVVQRSDISLIVQKSLVDLPMEKSDENNKFLNYQEIYGGCRCHGVRQPYCTCGPYPEPPCGSEGVTVTKKCTQKSDKKDKQSKETKSTRKRPCFHIWSENTRCLKRCPNRK